ncbi:nitric oxide dioxygenase [Curtobacterium sp. UNCCL20]|uniref:globin domain-containing protein n=1 Tax=Curtobacterium sp. UNCCL20 TaxID=1502773 RepID=UPI000891B240|nr:globin domain-containing protein [Curtobacterium sp. UNCCL20]SDQ10719.1 nitric oxide dioxygenase [Curtobacterium sp. UNCCL20]
MHPSIAPSPPLLTPAARSVVAATAPVIAARLPEITPDFYRRLFAAHPELLDGVFSRSNQLTGRQSSALAGSVVAFALAILDGEHPLDLVERIASRHAALGVTEELYAVVHEHLFAAIAGDLGAAASDDVVAAWSEVYWLFAGLLIARERALTGAQANSVHWADWRLIATTPRSASVRELEFKPADDTAVSSAAPGQYVSLRVRMPDGVRQARQYSLLEPGCVRRVGVKRDDLGEVSPVVLGLTPGAVVELSNPYGVLTLDDRTNPLVLATAGIGCTPAIGFLEGLAQTSSTRRVMVLHADRSRGDWAFADAVTTLVDKLPGASLHTWFEDDPTRPRMDLSEVPPPADATVVLCGPLGFMQAVRRQALGAGVPDTRIRYEVFGPDSWLKAA